MKRLRRPLYERTGIPLDAERTALLLETTTQALIALTAALLSDEAIVPHTQERIAAVQLRLQQAVEAYHGRQSQPH